MSLRNDKKIIYKLFEKYKQKYHQIPSLDSIRYTPNNCDALAQLNTYDLYSKKYILYIHPNLCSPFDYDKIKQVAFHEFTHIYDSIQLLDKDINSFKQLMKTYSEINATEIETRELILTQDKPYSLNKIVKGNIGDLSDIINPTLDSYIEISATIFTNNLIIHDKNIQTSDIIELYYLIGKIKALRYFKLDFNLNVLNALDDTLYDVIYHIINYCISNQTYDLNVLIQLYNQLICTINNI